MENSRPDAQHAPYGHPPAGWTAPPPPGAGAYGHAPGAPPGHAPAAPSPAHPSHLPAAARRAPRAHKPLDLPLIGATYPALLRTPRHRFWHPVLSFGIVVLGVIISLFVLMIPIMIQLFSMLGDDVVLSMDPADQALVEDAFFSAPIMAWNNVLLASLIPISILAIAFGHPVAARFIHSVTGRVRWRWLLRAHLVLLPLFLVYVLGTWWLDGAVMYERSEDWVWHVVMAFTLTPFQAAGEEYLFRGFLVLAICSLFPRPIIGLPIAAAVSALTFSLAHGSLDVWILFDLSVFALATVVLVWRTGGLEAAVALHVVNNVVVIAFGAITGVLNESFIDAGTSQEALPALLSSSIVVISTALLLWQARRAGVERTVPESVGARP
ncbi:MAG: CPBP family intramembrane metalloprotease [Micrococcus sp.]|nr:CPBP family intramembrane metalloprotease [Micrococcus sp.]